MTDRGAAFKTAAEAIAAAEAALRAACAVEDSARQRLVAAHRGGDTATIATAMANLRRATDAIAAAGAAFSAARAAELSAPES